MNKKAVATQAIFMILMIILMIGIIIFGIARLNDLESTLSDQQQLEIQEKISSQAQYCDNPLNSGSVIREEFETQNFNGICLINDEELPEELDSLDSDTKESLLSISKSGDNVVLINVEIWDSNTPSSLQIVDSFSTQSDKNQCWFGKDDILEVEMTC